VEDATTLSWSSAAVSEWVNSCACMTIYLNSTFALQAQSIHY